MNGLVATEDIVLTRINIQIGQVLMRYPKMRWKSNEAEISSQPCQGCRLDRSKLEPALTQVYRREGSITDMAIKERENGKRRSVVDELTGRTGG